MRELIVAAVALGLCFGPPVVSAQQFNSATRPPDASAAQSDTNVQPPLTARQREELQGRIYMAKKQYAEAVQTYKKLSAEYPRDASYLNSAGIAMMQQGDLNGARKVIERAVKVNKKFSSGYNNLGAIYYAQKQYKKAIRQYRKAVAVDPNTAGLYTNIGYAYFAEKKLPQAMEAFHKAMSIDPRVFEENDRNGSLMTYRSVGDHGLFDYMLAKGYAQDGDGPHCAVYLKKAVDDGYKDVVKVRTDPAFAKVLADDDVKAVLDQLPPAPEAKPVSTPPGT